VPLVELTGFNFTQSIEAPLTTTDTLILSGAVNADNGRGRGNVNVGLRKTFRLATITVDYIVKLSVF